MSGKKRNRNQDRSIQTIVLITAILNLLEAIVDIVHKLLE